ncbi:MAG: hypothetical protein HRU20_08315 [Pseudomonadales bacterium]|nr:hypothetical protein [Pseudomonadales bacterium]
MSISVKPFLLSAKALFCLYLSLSLWFSSPAALAKTYVTAHAEQQGFVVVARIDSPIPSLTAYQLGGIFLDKNRKIHGLLIQPLDLEAWQGVKQAFYKHTVQKNASQLNAYWARKLFTGRGKPPRSVPDVKSIYHYLRRNKQAIAYMAVEDADLNRVRIIYTVE